jgi:hypothetical protein
MNRREFVRLAVLGRICDDYENVDQTIFQEVAEEGAQRGIAVTRSDIVDALRCLIADGFAKAYTLSAAEPSCTELPAMPKLDIVEECCSTYFLATEKGIEFQLDDEVWREYEAEIEGRE